MSQNTLTIRLPGDLGQRLENLAKRTGRTKTFYATESILRHLEDMEDSYIAIERLEHPGRRYSLAEAKEALELES